MKIIYLLLCILSLTAFSQDISINKMEVSPDFERSFKLSGQKKSEYLILDCQSFFQKFDLYREGKLIEQNFISMKECVELFQITKTCLNTTQKKCFDMADIYSDGCHCNTN